MLKDEIEMRGEVNQEKKKKTRVNWVNSSNSQFGSWVWNNLIKNKLIYIYILENKMQRK
jgi:hypothetical protein